MSKKWFCISDDGLDAVIKTAAFMAAFTISKNNKELAKSILPVAEAIKTQVDAGGDNEALNALLKEAIIGLVDRIAKDDAVIKVAVEAVLAQLKINVPENTFPVLTNTVIDELVDSFVAGMKSGIAA